MAEITIDIDVVDGKVRGYNGVVTMRQVVDLFGLPMSDAACVVHSVYSAIEETMAPMLERQRRLNSLRLMMDRLTDEQIALVSFSVKEMMDEVVGEVVNG